jgi:tight adherence protein B
MATLIVLLIAFLIGAGVVLGGYIGAARVPGMMLQRKLDARLSEVSQAPEQREGAAPMKERLFKEEKAGPLPALERVLKGTAQGSAATRWLEQTGVRTTLSSVLLMALGTAALFGLGLSMATRSPWALPVGALLGFAVPFAVLNYKRGRRLRTFEEAFPEALDLISRALKAGHAFATGLKMVADEMDEPVGPEFRKTFDEQNFGLPLKDALDNLTQRVPIIDVRFFATAVLIQRETGGNLSEILENLAHVVRERFKILRQVRVYTAHGRMTGYVLLALPAVLCTALAFINPDHMNLLFRERMGQMLLMTAVVMQTIGYFWIRQVVKIEV